MAEHGSSGTPQWAPPGSPANQASGPPSGPLPQPLPQPAPQNVSAPQYAGAYPGGGTPPNFYTAPPPPGFGHPVGPPRPDGRTGPVRVEPVPGTEFGVAIMSVPPTFSGQAIGSLVAGIGSVAVSLVVGCFGFAGGGEDWGVLVSGAFAILAGLLGLASVGLGLVALRLIKASRGRIAGRGVAISGISCGGAGVVLTAGGMLLALAALVSV
jgi:hypothetical protein